MNPLFPNAGSARVFSVVGDRYHFLVTGEESGGAFALFDFLIPPRHGPPPHVHQREDEAFHITHGEFTFTVAGKEIRLSAGQTLFAKRGVPHTFKNTGNSDGRMIVVVSPAGLEKFFAEVGTPLDSPLSAPIDPTPADIERLVAAAPGYGLEILPPATP
ncbi:MAG: cupin domain-containing protein [Terrimicrobiaceae bacterium]